jgi:uncharacterized membrane protein HdeD (DUF308 family)
MSTQADPPERTAQGTSGTRLPAVARYWWLTALRGLVALTLALAITVAGRTTGRLITFLALFWMTGGLITLRFALAIRPRPGFRLGLAAAIAAVVGAVLVLLRDRLSGVVDPDVFVRLLGISAVLTGVLRILGGFAAEERLGRRWTIGGIVLGTLEVALGARPAGDQRSRPRPAGADRGRLGCGQRHPAAGPGAAAAPLRPHLAPGIGHAAPRSLTPIPQRIGS